MGRRLKMRYARFLFKKYGFNRGMLFEGIPLIYRLNPLFSPFCYCMVEGEQITKWMTIGMEQGIQDVRKMAKSRRGI